MSIARNAALVFLSVILTVSLPLAITALAANTMLYPDVYQQAMEKNDIYDMMQELLGKSGIPPELFSKEQMKSNIDRMLINLLAYMRSDTDELDLTLEIDPKLVKTLLASRISEYPICVPGQDPMKDNCRPAGMTSEQFLESGLAQKNVTLPEKINLADTFFKDKNSVDQARAYVSMFRSATIVLAIISLLCMALMYFLTRESLKSASKWLGSSLLISGATVIIAALLTNSAVEKMVAGSAATEFSGFIMDIVSSLTGTMMLYGGVVAALGIGLLAFSFTHKEVKTSTRR
ncbi:MAG: hypothetical protein HYW26_03320 [Candidatus Aenigmarchaeota archaeon]|nr:hypothetical protein [Candidatus Aenigmarchaeota archaeon]